MSEALRILLVEDEAILTMQLEMIVEEAGHIVVGTAASGPAAIAAADQVQPDLALVDVNLLDGPSGLAVARYLKRSASTLVVFVTANARQLPADFEGAAGVVTKPYTSAGMASALAYLSQCVREPPPLAAVPAGLSLSPAFSAEMAADARG